MTMFKACFITVPNLEEGKRLARVFLEERVAACVNIIPQVTSLYWWEGAIQEDPELLLVVKTSQDKLERLMELVRSHHPYQVAEVVSLPIEAGNPPYLQWLEDSLRESEGNSRP